ncbi:MAG: DUF4097 family beta strand repeat-containing protein [Myxococcota bacterium]
MNIYLSRISIALKHALVSLAVSGAVLLVSDAHAKRGRTFETKGVETIIVASSSGSLRVEVVPKASVVEVIVEDEPDYRPEPKPREDSNEDDEWDQFFGREPKGQRTRLRSERNGKELFLKHSSSDMVVRVPPGMNLKLKTHSGDIVLSGSVSRLEMASMSGSLTLKVQAASIEAKTVSGDVRVEAEASIQELLSISGDVRVSGTADDLRVGSTSGDVELRYLPKRLEAKSVSGEIRAKGRLAADAVHRLETVSGDMLLWLVGSQGFRLRATSFDSEIYVDKKRFDGSVDTKVGDGAASIKAATMNGEIRIRREQ